MCPPNVLTRLVLASGLLVGSLFCLAQSAPGGRAGSAKSPSHRADPKCSFLREEYARIKKDGESYVAGSSMAGVSQITQAVELGNTAQDLAEYVAESETNAAMLTILQGKIKSCDGGQSLSVMGRLPLIDALRKKHVIRVETRWTRLGGTR